MKIDIEGIVIKQVPYKEKDAMMTVLTKDGMVSFLARGVMAINSKNKSSCLLFSYSEFSLSSKMEKLTLTQGKLLKSYYHFYSSLDKLSSLNLVSECLIKFLDEDDKTVYPYLLNYLELLDRGFDELTLTTIMLAVIIKQSGYALEYNECVVCSSKKNIVGISFNLGGYLCKNCLTEIGQKKTKDYLKTFRYVFMVTPDLMTHYILNSKTALDLIKDFCQHLINSFDVKNIKALDLYLTNQ